MTWILLQLAFPLVVVGTALSMYRKSRAQLIAFREQLTTSLKGRRFIILMTMLSLLVYHFIALYGTSDALHLLPSSILTFLLFSQRIGEAIMRLMQKRGWGFAVFVMTLAATFLPETMPMGVTLLMLLIISWEFPTEEQMHKVSLHDDRTNGEVTERLCQDVNEPSDSIPSCFIGMSEMVDVDAEATTCSTATANDMEDDAEDNFSPYGMPSDKAIRKRKLREKERERRHSRAKRRARRARHGH